jgi:hypothetical protein
VFGFRRVSVEQNNLKAMNVTIPSESDPQFEALKASIKEGLAELDRGEGRPLDFELIKRKARERRILSARKKTGSKFAPG